MQGYSPGRRGRHKVVDKFGVREGLWILGLVIAAFVGFMVLWLLGYINFDAD